MRIKHVVRKKQVTFISKILWQEKDTPIKKILLEEFNIMGRRVQFEKLTKSAMEYGLKRISECPVDKTVFKHAVKSCNDSKVWSIDRY